MTSTTAPRDALQRAYCLHRRDYRDTSLLVELFVDGAGRCAAISKGARRRRNPAGALLQPFQPLWLALAGHGEVQTLTRVEPAGRPLVLAGSALPCGFYLNELIVRLLGRQDPHEALFAYYHVALAELAAPDPCLDDVLRRFELHLLTELGHAPDLMVDALSGEPVRPGRTYRAAPGLGPVHPPDGGPGPWVRGEVLLALGRAEPLPLGRQKEARTLLRSLLYPHLGGKPLKSRELFRRLRGGRVDVG